MDEREGSAIAGYEVVEEAELKRIPLGMSRTWTWFGVWFRSTDVVRSRLRHSKSSLQRCHLTLTPLAFYLR